MKMKTRSILLVLGLAMIQDQISSKHYLVESKGKQYLVETEGRTQVGRGDVTFLGLDSSFDTFNESKLKNDDYDYDDEDEQPADKVTGGERPLGEKLPDGFEVKAKGDEGSIIGTYTLTGAIELHRLVLEDYDQLKKRKNEITKTIIDSTCAIDDEHDGHYKEVIQMPLPLLPRSRHCSSLVGSELIKPLKQRPYS